jgi:hypothetical protein
MGNSFGKAEWLCTGPFFAMTLEATNIAHLSQAKHFVSSFFTCACKKKSENHMRNAHDGSDLYLCCVEILSLGFHVTKAVVRRYECSSWLMQG